ncbi:hypothetical protein SUDANB121_05767 [Nocardiopsis dassonvillei]|uniref:transcriptional regulator n=1 Tax=Nocardiopsis dassonvillei TaxID=2014 RepID=UPI003F56B31C
MTAGHPDDRHAGRRQDGVRPDGSSPPARAAAEATRRSRPELLVLHTVRLAGFAGVEAVADRAGLAGDTVLGTLRALEGRKLVEHIAFADSAGWILTEAGKARNAELLRHELEASGARPVLEAASEDFEPVNSRFVRMVTEWQLAPSSGHAEMSTGLLRELTGTADVLRGLMAGPTERLERFGRYPRQFSAALEKARSGDHRWIAGVGILSCHTVWAELHEDLLSSLGRDRSSEPHERGR